MKITEMISGLADVKKSTKPIKPKMHSTDKEIRSLQAEEKKLRADKDSDNSFRLLRIRQKLEKLQTQKDKPAYDRSKNLKRRGT